MDKSVDGVVGTQTQGGMMEGADQSTGGTPIKFIF